MKIVNRIRPERLSRLNRGPITDIWQTKVKPLWAYSKDLAAEAPPARKAMAAAAIIYLVFPLDAIPDFIPVVGLADDAGIIIAVAARMADDLKKYLPLHVRGVP